MNNNENYHVQINTNIDIIPLLFFAKHFHVGVYEREQLMCNLRVFHGT